MSRIESIIATVDGASNASFGVKVSFGNDMRRASCPNVSYAALSDVVAKLFGFEQASLLLKYQDDDGDKVTMSSDEELQEALRLNKDKIIRLYAETNKPINAGIYPNPVAPNPEVRERAAGADAGEFPHPFAFGWRGGRGGRGGMMRGGMMRGGPFRHGFNHHHHARFGPFAGPFPHSEGHGHHGPHHFGPHGEENAPFFPNSPFFGRGGPGANPEEFADGEMAMKCRSKMAKHMAKHEEKMAKNMWKKEFKDQFKERKQQMKKAFKEMKENAKTPEEIANLKALKKQMKAEFREEKQQYKPWKEDKKDKKCKKDKKDKHDKKHKKHHCDDDEERFKARHVADVTIPDNCELPPNTPVTKTWKLRNAGTTAWPAGCQLIAVGRHGDNLNGPERVIVTPAAPGQETEVSVPFLTPAQPGRYIGYYRMATAEGVKFGQRVWVSFLIAPYPVAMD